MANVIVSPAARRDLIGIRDYISEELANPDAALRSLKLLRTSIESLRDGNSALMLVCARLRHVAGSQWGNKKYMSMKHLEALHDEASVAG